MSIVDQSVDVVPVLNYPPSLYELGEWFQADGDPWA